MRHSCGNEPRPRPDLSQRVENYAKYRPRYPAEILQLLRAECRFGEGRVIAATAEETTLPDVSVDFVTAGQAFHWFNLEAARQEFGRIQAPGVYRERMFEKPLKCDLAGLQGRVLSNEPALKAGDPLYGDMLATLEEIFSRYQEDGSVTFEHDTRLVYGQLQGG